MRNTNTPAINNGVTIIEFIIGLTFLSLVVAGAIAVFSLITKGLLKAKTTSLATSLAQEKIESLKNISYYRLLVTTSPVSDTRVTPAASFDPGYYPPETLVIGGVRFDREVEISRVEKGASDENLIELPAAYADTGLKLINVYVLWQEQDKWRIFGMQNLKENPSRASLGCALSGQVRRQDTLVLLDGVSVEVLENPSWFGQTDIDGNYSFSLGSGTYTLRIYKTGFAAKSETIVIPANSSVNRNFMVSPLATGKVIGTAWISTTPASGAYVWSDDPLNTTTLASATGYFELPRVATGAWTITMASGAYSFSAAITVSEAATLNLGSATLASITNMGYVSGAVTVGGSNIAIIGGETVKASVLGVKTYTNSDPSGDNYFLALPPGAHTLSFNANNANPRFTSASTNVSVSTNASVHLDVSLSMGGQIWGYVLIGGSALPGIVVSAKKQGLEMASATSGVDGKYTITNLSTGSYTLEPNLDPGEASSPPSQSLALSNLGDNVQAANFIVSGSMGAITGLVTDSGQVITTGVLIVATTSSIVSDPPLLSSQTLSATNIYYGGSSFADGAYRVSVKGNAIYNVYAWYTKFSGENPTIARKSASGISVLPNQTRIANFNWP